MERKNRSTGVSWCFCLALWVGRGEAVNDADDFFACFPESLPGQLENLLENRRLDLGADVTRALPLQRLGYLVRQVFQLDPPVGGVVVQGGQGPG